MTLTRGLLCLVLVSVVAACEEAPADGPPAATVVAIQKATSGLSREGLAGRSLFSRYCVVCHGTTGAGDGFNADNLAARPPALPQRIQALGKKGVQAHLERGTQPVYSASACPPYGGNLSSDNQRILTRYILDVLPTIPTVSKPQ